MKTKQPLNMFENMYVKTNYCEEKINEIGTSKFKEEFW
jgi:hypothetical protein